MMADGGDIVNINERRKQLNLTLKEIAEYVGVSEATVSRWESGNIANMRRDRIAALAQILKVSPIDIMGVTDDNYDESIKSVQIPVLGYVKAGIPMTAVENIIDYEEISQEQARTGEFFGLKIKGDSMEPKMSDGDVIIVKKQECVDNGDIAVVLVNGNDATVKKFYKNDNGIKLVASNPIYDPFFYTPAEVDSLPVIIVGKVVELRAKF